MGREWRKLVKKLRRKRIRRKAAQERDAVLEAERLKREASPSYQTWLSSQKALELFQEEEETRLSVERNAKWLADEAKAQKLWSDLQEKLAAIQAERAKQEVLIQEEWKEEQRKVKEAKEEQERRDKEKLRKQEEVLHLIEDLITRGSELPPDLNVASETNPNQPACPFFTKTGACRFGDRCSRNHPRPGISRVLLVPSFYDHLYLHHTSQEEFENAEISLEYDDSETYQHFLEFYEDVVPEFKRIGRISQFKVCCNHEAHLRGNVYVEYENAHDAVQAYKAFNGRWYAGRQLSVEFVNINSWKAAICGQFHKKCCPKGRACNFLHVFRNPSNAFVAADRDQQAWRQRHRSKSRSRSRSRSRSWSKSPTRRSRNGWQWSPSPPPNSRCVNGRTHEDHTSNNRYRESSSRSRSYRYSSHRSKSRSPNHRLRRRKSRSRSPNQSERGKNRSKSRSPGHSEKRKNRSRSRSPNQSEKRRNKSRSRSRSRSPGHGEKRRYRSRSRSPNQSERDWNKSRSRSRSRSPNQREKRKKGSSSVDQERSKSKKSESERSRRSARSDRRER